MSNQIGGDEIEQFVTKAAKFDTPSGVSVTVEFDDGSVITHEWGTVEATSEPTTPEQGVPTTPERNEA